MDTEMRPRLERTAEASDELWEVAQQYWALDGFDGFGKPAWSVPRAAELDTDAGKSGDLAGVGAFAYVDDKSCRNCGGPLTLTSRSRFGEVLAGLEVPCRACTSNFERRIASILDPAKVGERARKAEAQRAATAAKERAAEDQQTLARRRREGIASTYPLESAVRPADELRMFDRLAALTVARYLSDDGIVGPLEGEVVAPGDLRADALRSILQKRSLVIHPSTSSEAFIWDEDDPGVLGDRMYTDRLRFHAGVGPATQAGLDELAEELHASFDFVWFTSADVWDLRDTATSIIAAEAARYFDHLLVEHGLPEIADRHRERMRLLFERAFEDVSLGVMYRWVWTSARDAAAVKAQNPYMPRDNASTHGLNKLEVRLQAAIDAREDSPLREAYRETTALPLTELTRVTFYEILGVDPMAITGAELDRVFADPLTRARIGECVSSLPDGSIAADALRRRSDWTAQDLRGALETIRSSQPYVCANGCPHADLTRMAGRAAAVYDKLARRVGDDAAAIAVVESVSEMLYQLDGKGFALRYGDLLLHELAQALGLLDEPPPGD